MRASAIVVALSICLASLSSHASNGTIDARRKALLHELIEEGDTIAAKVIATRWQFSSKDVELHFALESGTLDGLRMVFFDSEDPDFFAAAGCTLFAVSMQSKVARESLSDIYELLYTGNSSWSPSVRKRAMQRAEKVLGSMSHENGGVGHALASAVTGFYRFAIAPAIGARCGLTPSCSSYYAEASRKHGLLGIPMITDRFVREPVESASTANIINLPTGGYKHADPVSNHDFWFHSEQTK